MPLLECRGLTRNFGALVAVDAVDLTVEPGEIRAVIGPNGAGKSTFFNLINGMLRPTAGSVLFDGKDITGLAAHRIARHGISRTFQLTHLMPDLTARENVSLVTEIATAPLRPDEALELVGLSDRMDHFPAQLSGGEQQRVAVARAIAKKPDVLLCDEPTGALDSKTGIAVLEAIELVNREFGTTAAVITHNAAIADIADRVVIFADGALSEVRVNLTKIGAAEVSW